MNRRCLDRSVEIAMALYERNRDGLRCQHTTIAWNKNRIVVIGQNSSKTHPINLKNYTKKDTNTNNNRIHLKGICSELSVFQKMKKTNNIPFEDCDLVNVRITRNKEIGFCHPCSFCVNLIEYLSPKSLYYTIDGGGFERYI